MLSAAAVVQIRSVDDMAQRIDVTVGVAVHVHRQPVHGKRQPGRVGLIAGCTGHLMDTRIRVIDRHLALHRGGKRRRAADADLPHCGQHVRLRDVVQRAASVSCSPHRRTLQPLVENLEVRSGHHGYRLRAL
jgi:hypothetical protein